MGSPPIHKNMSFIIAVTNQKGGVGKSTTTFNLGAGLAEAGFPTLLVDLDPQAGLTKMVGAVPEQFGETIYDALRPERSVPVERLINPVPGLASLDFLPANLDLAGAEAELIRDVASDWRSVLSDVLAPVRGRYAYILVDCPPSLGVLTTNALVAADGVLVPLQTEFIALTSLSTLQQIVGKLRQKTKPGLAVWVVPTFFDARTNHSREVLEDLKARLPEQVSQVVIPKTVRFPDSTVEGKPLIHFDPTHAAAHAYRGLVKEIQHIWPSDVHL